MGEAATTSLEAAREATERFAWSEAYELLSADGLTDLEADDLERLAAASWWTGRLDECIEARERAYALHGEAGNPMAAARMAMALAANHQAKHATSVAAGWRARAERLLADASDSVEHGYLARLDAQIAFEISADLDRSYEEATRALQIGERFGDRDLQAMSLHDQGRALAAKGEIEQAMPLLEEATAAAVSGELGAVATAVIYCNMITTCGSLGDYQRAGEWTKVAQRWCERQEISGFPGRCRVYRAELLRLRGSWSEAQEEAERASAELRDFDVDAAAGAFYEIGELRLRTGDLAGAEQAFGQAHELGRDPQPGMAQLRFAQGKRDSAQACIDRALDEESRPLHRARLLPARVELAIDGGDRDAARVAASELEEIASTYEALTLAAAASAARGRIDLAEGDAVAALRSLRGAERRWREAEMPYERAVTGVDLAGAYRDSGDLDSAVLELRSAADAFDRLGAVPDARRARDLLVSWSETADETAQDRVAATLMFTDIAGSTPLVDAIGDEAWGKLRAWHDRALRAVFAEHGGEEVDHAGDGFFVAFTRPADALACAIALQRRLAEHRRESGFAPQVRVGVHATEATREAGDYKGRGVHEAARIGALAAGDQILASLSTVGMVTEPPAVAERRTLALEGLADPVEVVSVVWR